MHVLILSCNTGEGHNSCAKAIKEVFDNKGEACEIADALNFMSENISRFISWGHIFVYRNFPEIFNIGYGFAEKHKSTFAENSPAYNFFRKGVSNLSAFIVEGCYDTVICTHPFAALLLTQVQRSYSLQIRTAFVATDYTCSPSVKDSDLDYYFIPDESLSGEFESTNIRKDKLAFSGIPIRQMFFKSVSRAEAKKTLGIDPDKKHVIVVCGSMGCGPIKKLSAVITEKFGNALEMTVVCGTNDRLKTGLERKYGDRKNLHICGYVTDMSLLLDSADLYLTKAGGISVTEAAAKKVPMVFVNAVTGCEAYNSEFYTRIGCAKKSSGINELLTICSSLVMNDDNYKDLAAAFDHHRAQDSAGFIYNTLKDSF